MHHRKVWDAHTQHKTDPWKKMTPRGQPRKVPDQECAQFIKWDPPINVVKEIGGQDINFCQACATTCTTDMQHWTGPALGQFSLQQGNIIMSTIPWPQLWFTLWLQGDRETRYKLLSRLARPLDNFTPRGQHRNVPNYMTTTLMCNFYFMTPGHNFGEQLPLDDATSTLWLMAATLMGNFRCMR